MKEVGFQRFHRTIHSMLVVVSFCLCTYGKTIYVDDDARADFNNIQAAINAAENGDTVSVAPGTYFENIILKNGIILFGAGANVTIIDANGYGDVVDARANDVTISGFTLRNSGQFDLGHMNCGVYLDGSYAPIIRHNVIADNQIGIGVWDGAKPDVRNNIIRNNYSGFYIYGSEEYPSNPAIINNTIVNNEIEGITLRVMVSPVIINNIITGHAYGINHNYVTGAPIIHHNNLWHNNVNYLRDNGSDDTLAGPDSISVDPYFAKPGYWEVNGTPNDPNDDFWIEGDYHLKSQAGRWDPTNQSWVIDYVTSPCIDTGDPNMSVGDEPEPNGGRINMGAYGGTAEASKSPSGLHSKYSGGTGEPNDPYQIATAEDLLLLGDSPEDYDKHFILTADIDLDPNLPGRRVFDRAVIAPDPNDGTDYCEPDQFDGTPFTGIFDGDNYAISNMKITGVNYVGLFGQLASGARISNLCLEAVDVNGTCNYVGGLVAQNWGNLANCWSTGTVSGYCVVGGLLGRNAGSIDHCFNTCTVSGGYEVGGLVGNSYYGKITTSYNTGTVGGRWGPWVVGGLVGRNSGSVHASYNTGVVSGELVVGGLVGSSLGEGWGESPTVTASYSTGAVRGGDQTGGLVGSNGGSVSNCHSTGTVSGGWQVGGLVGDNLWGNIITSYSTGTVSARKTVGGLVGYSDGSITASYSTGMVTGEERIGGLVGGGPGSTTSSFWDIETSGQTTSEGGTGKTTAEMQTASTFLEAGWDLVNETTNGTEDIWWIDEGQEYPRLWWELIE